MKTKAYSKQRKSLCTFRSLCALCVLGLLCALCESCTDWDDHYDANTAVTDSQHGSLWTNIEQNGQLTQFASLLKKTGYDQVLNQAQTYTVWAPQDGTFDYETLMQQADDRVRQQFVENHIARNNYPASGSINERVYMLNKKVMRFASSGDGYLMQDVSLSLPSIGSNNGTIHQLRGKVPFLQNIYESLNSEQFALDSISAYYHRFDTLVLNEQMSVQGPAVNGEITYLDSILDERNELYTRFRAYINREDSSYTMLMPTNAAWHKAKEHLRAYFCYTPQMKIYRNASEKTDTTIRITDPAGLQDSLATVYLMRDLFFNNRLYDNKHLASLAQGAVLQCDSLVSTGGTVTKDSPYQPFAADMFRNAIRVDKSNGAIWVTDTLCQASWLTWCPPSRIEAESSFYLAGYTNTAGDAAPTANRTRITAENKNPAVEGTVSGGRYLEVEPSSQRINQSVTFSLPQVRSTTYHIYVTVPPAHIANTYMTDVLPQRMMATMVYSNVNESSKRMELKETQLVNPSDGTNYYLNDITRVDTLDLGEFTFPSSYVGLGDATPYIRFDSRPRTGHDHTMRFDCIYLIPKELDDFLKAHGLNLSAITW